MKFFQVMIPVIPKPDHPAFFEIQSGLMIVFLFAPSVEEAGAIAHQIVSLLPYELNSEKVGLFEQNDQPPPSPLLKLAFESGRVFGLGLQLIASPTGNDLDFEEVMEQR